METAEKPRLLDQARYRCRVKHYSIRTEKSYTDWIRLFILFHGKRHPSGMGAKEVEAFLTHLAVNGNVAATTQNQALAAMGGKDRRTMLPRSLVEPLKHQIERVRVFHEQDIHNNIKPVYLPYALVRKYPNAGRELQ